MSITWNGVCSDTIGVIVERIPNRYVPTRRFSPQQVAGRNGNILLVDKSFPNVEQEYEVYLSAEAQGLPSVARACAEWLMGPDGYCRLQDSYDTTVYREAFLMGGYDLENILNKFGRCTITFSCKPQKYLLAGDTPISIPAGATTTYTGSSVQFDGITGASITSLSTTITPTQDLHGYANPWPAGGGKNLVDVESPQTITSQTELARYATSEQTTFTVSATIKNNVAIVGMLYIYLFNNNTYIRNVNVTVPASAGAARYSCTVDCSNTVYNNMRVVIAGQSAGYNLTVSDVQLEKNSTVTSFAPYANICPISGLTGLSVYVSPTQDPDDATVYNVDWSAQAGTVYHGTVDVVTGELTVDMVSVNLNPAAKYENANGYFWYTTNTELSIGAISGLNAGLISNRLVALSNVAETTQEGKIVFYANGIIRWKEQGSLSLADYRTYLASNPLQIVYELATPLTYQLTPQEIGVLTGTNYVWLSDGDVSLTVTTPMGGIVTNPTPFEARPLLEVSGVGEITINGKSIQILESVSDFDIDCETMEAEDNSKIYSMDFPELSGGENEIVGDGSITALTVTPRWWTL